MSSAPVLIWFRLDLRLADQPALAAARQRGGPVIPVYIAAPDEDGDWPPGAASNWWLHQSLAALAGSLHAIGSRLVIRRGASLPVLRALAKETGAQTVLWNRRYEPAAVARDRQIKADLRADGLTVESFNSALLFEPWTVANQSGRPFQVFTPYWHRCLKSDDPAKPLPAPRSIPTPSLWPASEPLESLGLDPQHSWTDGLSRAWQPGEIGAGRSLRRFCERRFEPYPEARNRPDLDGTSRLSPHLHFGEISPRQIWHNVKAMAEKGGLPTATWRQSQFLAEIGWREFAHHLVYHFPSTPAKPLRPDFARFPWRRNSGWLRAWQQGRTGYPIVDAGMRELWTTGWMHNRVRMITASFLVKDLLIDWREGARWFWNTLVDADLASNTLGWQWSAGCGADAAPFFRIFNPTAQGQKFDPNGDYVRRWLPKLARLPSAWIHQPSDAPLSIRRTAGVELDQTYPAPIVRHAIAREVALEALARIKKRGAAAPRTRAPSGS
jgi:deoxyribodipyrimidine photo-lyase